VADSDGVIRETTLQPFAERLADPAMRHSVEDAVRGAFNAAGDPSPPKDAERIVQEQLDGFLENLRAALNRWCDRYHALLRELIELRRAGGLPTKVERDREERLRDELVRMAEPRTPEYLPLGFLGLVGFLPRYGFTGESVLLHPPRGEEPIAQSGVVAVTEFAPGNTVYARGRKMKVQRLDPAPVPQGEAEAGHRDNLLREGHRCDACEFLTFDPLMKTCPTCGSDLVAQSLVEFTGVSASGSPISSDDEYRSHSYYDVGHILGGHAGASDIVTIAGTQFERTSGRDITVANRGPAAAEGERPIGFEACLGCGFAAETQKDEEPEELGEEQDAVGVPGHAPRCPGAKDKTVVRKGLWLTARIRGDAMEMLLPEGVRGEKEFESWRATLAEALRIGIRETMQAGQRDLGYFIRQQNGGPYSLVIYDTMPGGTGYLPKLFENGAAGLKAAAEEALNRLSSCECSASCHRCLRDFWNQRLHRLFNRFEVFGMLRRLAEGKPTVAELEENEKLESFLEQEFFDRLRAAGLPTPTLQVVREVGGPMITIVDAEYRDPDVSIYLDGREYHVQSIEKIQHDLARRNVLEDKGVLVLEFTYYDVMARFDEIVTSIRRALKSEQNDDPLGAEIALLPGLKLVGGPDMASKRAVFEVDAAAWRASEDARAASLRSANRLRLAGWRIRREVGIGAGEEPA
jgi:very-short-patch-repair endonuclease